MRRTDASLSDRMGWQERSEVRSDSNRAYTRPAATMWNAEGLMQVQMAHICTNLACNTDGQLQHCKWLIYLVM